MKKMSYVALERNRKAFLQKHKNQDHVCLLGSNKVLISVPHGVPQVRLGKYKLEEIGSLSTGLLLKEKTDSFLLAKTQNNCDDAGFDENSSYKRSLCSIIEQYNIKYVIDIHGLAAKRNCDINLGTHLGENVSTNPQLLDSLITRLQKDFSISVDQPFMANKNTISTFTKKLFEDVWTLQIEINCAITNKRENFEKFEILLKSLKEWIESLG